MLSSYFFKGGGRCPTEREPGADGGGGGWLLLMACSGFSGRGCPGISGWAETRRQGDLVQCACHHEPSTNVLVPLEIINLIW